MGGRHQEQKHQVRLAACPLLESRKRFRYGIARSFLTRPPIGERCGVSELHYPFHHGTITVTRWGRICMDRRKINFSTVFAGQNVGVKQIAQRIWLVSFMDYDLGFFDDQTCRLEPAENPFQAKVLPMSPV